MTFRSFVRLLTRQWTILVVGLLVGILGGAGLTLATTKTYTADCQLLVTVGGKNNLTDLNQGATYVERSISTFAEAATSPYVLNPVIKQLKLDTTADDLTPEITASVPTSSTIILLTASRPTAQSAADVANAVADQLVTAIAQLAPGRDTGGSAVSAKVIQQASAPTTPATPKTSRNLGLGLASGFILALVVILIRDALDQRIATAAKLRRQTALPVLSAMTRTRGGIDCLSGQKGPEPMAIRRLHSSLVAHGVVAAQAHSVVAITSDNAGPGCGRWAAQLADCIGHTDLRVAFVTSEEAPPVLSGDHAGIRVVQIDPDDTDTVLSSGFADGLSQLQKSYDIVVINAPDLTESTFAIRSTQLADQVLIAVDVPLSTERSLHESLSTLAAEQIVPLGMVVSTRYRSESFTGGAFSAWEPVRPARAA